jgi:anti-sigma regulatory factor (Ser/Thr protein kinase)
MKDVVTLKMTLPKVPDIELVAIEGMERMARHKGIDEGKIGEAKLVVAEAIINALEHSGDEMPLVKVEFALTSNQLVIYVRDYGKGFDPTAVEDPDIATKLGSRHKRGWGLKLMKSLSDGFRIESGGRGTRITITKLLT